ncbi:MAG: MoaD/ThiS family protein [Saprospiraceae bacterium]|nr:MoaD/ThiS family protein [Saprospiraceae bacterium]MBK6564186.1 MoaD/ThiS family protein [Saprospiraceae bacterium]MBK6782347.1 MoaD/ThiS family protein [Saprospiraceae bacterium]MBK7524134.1 MoaD/ThiS family protein [Saprospiraceae bacterium]MBK8078885.1 MoaD/ThiS family protein [Saprospiraceae bacterium]
MIVKPFGKIVDVLQQDIVPENKYQNWMELQKHLFERFPELKNEHYLVAINHKIISEKENPDLQSGDEIALLPPFSGG